MDDRADEWADGEYRYVGMISKVDLDNLERAEWSTSKYAPFRRCYKAALDPSLRYDARHDATARTCTHPRTSSMTSRPRCTMIAHDSLPFVSRWHWTVSTACLYLICIRV